MPLQARDTHNYRQPGRGPGVDGRSEPPEGTDLRHSDPGLPGPGQWDDGCPSLWAARLWQFVTAVPGRACSGSPDAEAASP